jgi:polysaccharide deacetylase family protein (PEP-CTERM system associated)
VAQPLLLSVDFEDWHQLVRRRVGVKGREPPGPALERQTEALLGLLDELGARATFFILGMAARDHPDLVAQILRAGHELGCHGDQHVPVHTQSPDEFARDVRRARETIEQLTGVRPAGYRAPAFSITRESAWAYDVLAREGFTYDSSQHDSPRLRGRIREGGSEPHLLQRPGGALWELPIAVWQTRGGPVPVGGPSYWSILPTRLILHGLGQAGALAGLYLHPQELDPRPLRAELPPGARAGQRARGGYRAVQRNLTRWRAADVLRAVAKAHDLIPYGEGHARLAHSSSAGAESLHGQGAPVRRPL